MRKHYRWLVMILGLLLVVSALGWAAAQDDSNQEQPYLGISVGEAENGVEVTRVASDSPAEEAGIEVGDIIQSINDEEVSADTIREVINEFSVGDEISLSLQRDDEVLTLNVTLAARPARESRQEFRLGIPAIAERPMLGVRLEDTDEGAVIREVVADSPAEEAGLQVDDVIVRIGDETITNARDAVEAVQELEIGDTVAIEIQRGDETLTLEATLDSATPFFRALPFAQSIDGFSILYQSDDQTWTIGNISENSALYEAGVREGDVIREFNGNAYDPRELGEYLNDLDDDAEVTLTIERDGETQEISVPADALNDISGFGLGPSSFRFFGPNGRGFGLPFTMGQLVGGGRLGVQFVTLDEEEAEERNITQTEGALVIDVIDDTPAEKAGLRVNDIITAVNGEPVDAEHTLQDRLVAYEEGDVITLDVTRGDETLSLEVTLEGPEFPRVTPFFGDGEIFQFFGIGPDGLEFRFPFDIPQSPKLAPPLSNI